MYPGFVIGCNQHRPDELTHPRHHEQIGSAGAGLANLYDLGDNLTLNSSPVSATMWWEFSQMSPATNAWPAAVDPTNHSAQCIGQTADFQAHSFVFSNTSHDSGFNQVNSQDSIWLDSNATAQLDINATADVLIESVVRWGSHSNGAPIFGQRSPLTAGGWAFYYTSATQPQFILDYRPAETTYLILNLPSPTAEKTYHYIISVDRSGTDADSIIVCINGERNTSISLTGVVEGSSIGTLYHPDYNATYMAGKDFTSQNGGYAFHMFGSANRSGAEYTDPGALYWLKAWSGVDMHADGSTHASEVVGIAANRYSQLVQGESL